MRALSALTSEWRSAYRSPLFELGTRPLETGFLPIRYRVSDELDKARRALLRAAAVTKKLHEEKLLYRLDLLKADENKEIREMQLAAKRPNCPEGAKFTEVSVSAQSLQCRPSVGSRQLGPTGIRSSGTLSPKSRRSVPTVLVEKRTVTFSAPISELRTYAFVLRHGTLETTKNLVTCLEINDEMAFAHAVDIVSARSRQGAIDRFHALHKVQAFGNGEVNKYAVADE